MKTLRFLLIAIIATSFFASTSIAKEKEVYNWTYSKDGQTFNCFSEGETFSVEGEVEMTMGSGPIRRFRWKENAVLTSDITGEKYYLSIHPEQQVKDVLDPTQANHETVVWRIRLVGSNGGVVFNQGYNLHFNTNAIGESIFKLNILEMICK